MIVLAIVLTCLLLANVVANFDLFGRWRDSQAKLDEAKRQLARIEQSVQDQHEQLAAAHADVDARGLGGASGGMRTIACGARAIGAVRRALGKRYEDTRAELAIAEVRLEERDEEIKIFYDVVDSLSRTITSERSTKARINAIQDFITRCQSLLHSFRSPA